jgi:hypothetical protein
VQITGSYDPVTGELDPFSSPNWSIGDTSALTPHTSNVTRDWHYKGFRQSNIALQFESRPSDKWQYDVQYYHMIDENNLWVHNLLEGQGGHLTGYSAKNPEWYRSGWFSKGNGIEANASAALGAKHQLSFGAKYIALDWHTDENNSNKRDEGTDKRRSFYVEEAWSFDARTRMTLGVRYEGLRQTYNKTNESKDSATDPVLNITHDLTKYDTVRFSAGRTHFFIQPKSVASNIRMKQPLPKPERNRNFEIGWKHKFGAQNSVDLAVFRTDVTDRIVSTGMGKNRYYINLDKTRIRGVELGYQQNFGAHWHTFANYTWLRAEDTDKGVKKDATGLPSGMFNLGATYRMGKWQSTLLGRAVRGWKNNDSDYPNSAGYFTMDLDLRYRPQTDLEWFVRVNNLFNTEYQDSLYHPAQGTNVMLGVEMDF